MIIVRQFCTVLSLGLLATTALPLRADVDDSRGDQRPRREQGPGPHRATPPANVQRPAQPAPRPDFGDDKRRGERGVAHPPVRTTPPVRREAPKPPPGFVLDPRHGHNHYYPPRGHIEPMLPPKRQEIRYHDRIYYYHSGIWYRPSGIHFVVVLPPFGIVVPVLPPFFTILWVGAIPYYYADGVYYLWQPYDRGYVVAEPPPDSEILEDDSDELTVYPLQGQSDEQIAKDRYDCHRQAIDRTGYDPAKPGGNVPDYQHAGKRDEYFRVVKSCLEERGYRVQ